MPSHDKWQGNSGERYGSYGDPRDSGGSGKSRRRRRERRKAQRDDATTSSDGSNTDSDQTSIEPEAEKTGEKEYRG